MSEYEYATASAPNLSDLEERIDVAGAAGWETVNAWAYNFGTLNKGHAVLFRRPRHWLVSTEPDNGAPVIAITVPADNEGDRAALDDRRSV